MLHLYYTNQRLLRNIPHRPVKPLQHEIEEALAASHGQTRIARQDAHDQASAVVAAPSLEPSQGQTLNDLRVALERAYQR